MTRRERATTTGATPQRAVRAWRSRARPVWREIQWVALVLLALAALILGAVGFHASGGAKGASGGWADAIYAALQLFGLNWNAPSEPIPVTLQIARFVAPLVSGYAAVAAIFALFRDQLQLLRIRRLARDHIVVAGLGTIGSTLAATFADSGPKVVAVERQAGTALTESRARGIIAIIGDATLPEALRRARVDRARHLIVACGDDAINLDVLFAAQEVASSSRRPPDALVHLDDLDLWGLLEAEALTRPERFGLRLHLFNGFEAGARMLLEEHPPFDDEAPHLLFVGLDGVGESLLLHTAALWQRTRDAAGSLRVTIIDPRAEERFAALITRYPRLDEIVVGSMHDGDLGAASIRRGIVPSDAAPPTRVYVSTIPSRRGLVAALALRTSGQAAGAPIVVAVGDETRGVGSTIRAGGAVMPDVHAFGVWGRTLTPDLLVRGATEVIARAMHQSYVRTELARGRELHSGVTLQPWTTLPEEYKLENRRFAESVPAKLAAAECFVVPNPLVVVPVPAADPTVSDFFFREEVERLARIEHDRWWEQKRLDGWSHGETKSDEARTHPLMVPWEQLDEVDRDKDRVAIVKLPGMLAEAGFEILRARDLARPPRMPSARA